MDADDFPVTRQASNKSFNEILTKRISRRGFLKNSVVLSASTLLNNKAHSLNQQQLNFTEVTHGLDANLHLAENYSAQILLRWGDAIFPNFDAFDPTKQSAKSQLKRFGYNNDFVAYLPISKEKNVSSHGLLAVNHEYVNSNLMHPDASSRNNLSRQQIDIEMAAHGLSIVEVYKKNDNWSVALDSKFSRRISPTTSMRLSGPARNHIRVKTEYSPRGEACLGTFGNCAGCVTPWGTILTAEENFQFYFSGNANKTPEYKNYKRLGLLGTKTALSLWGKYHEQWNLDHHPQAAMHAGWIVEIDPFDSNFVPIKRTALGRCKHEGCDVHINKDGKAVIYMGDDQAFEYVYRFVSKHKYQAGKQKQNLALLDEGELSVAEFTEHGSVIWHSLQYGEGPHIQKNGFSSQADVVIDMRKAADLVGATPMDRPEEIKVNPQSGNVFAVLTNNFKRTKRDAANPRAINRHGHILELIPPDHDHSAKEFKWEIFILAGNIKSKIDQAYYHKNITVNGWFSSPDNCSFDEKGNIWIATDGFNRSGIADGIWVSATQGKQKALTKQFLRAPIGSEICSPCFTPDQKTMFCSIQHPGAGSSFQQPSTRWPDFDESMPPRPAVIAVTQDQGEMIGD
ncbi:MAG: PhoX family phosphatase [Pseudomonadota bacterium]